MVRESMKNWLLILVLGASTVLLAKDKPYESFLKNLKSHIGHYELVKGNKRCNGDQLVLFNDKNIEEGFRIGHDIYFSSISDSSPSEEQSGDCSVNTKYSYTSSSISLRTEISRCPASLKKEEAVSTKVFSIKEGRIYYSVKENGFSCEYKKVANKGGK